MYTSRCDIEVVLYAHQIVHPSQAWLERDNNLIIHISDCESIISFKVIEDITGNLAGGDIP
jgi:hypothetical protein